MNTDAVTEGSNFGLLDLKADDFAANEIFTLMRMGIFDVPSDGYFKPDKFITYKVRIEWNEIHEYIRQMRTGLTVPRENKYRTLR